MERFTSDGRLIIPFGERGRRKDNVEENRVRYVVQHAYCPAGCSIMDIEHKINGFPGLRIAFRREDCEGVFVISAIEGDFDKIMLSGDLKDGVRDDLFCPHCGRPFHKLVNCNCHPGGELVVIGLTPEFDFNNAITFCNVTGCKNGSFVQAGEVLRHMRLESH